jgi:glycosyltransferase involved in cell wall biosynthesis
MDLILITNSRFSQHHKNIYGYYTSINYNTVQQYRYIFDKVYIVARVKHEVLDDVTESMIINKDNVGVLPITPYRGPLSFILKKREINNQLRNYLSKNAVIICRVPGSLGRLASYYLQKRERPYGVEVVGDPFELFAPDSYRSILRIPLRLIGRKQLQRIVYNSSAAIYVTEKKLQNNYPVKKGVFSTNASNVLLPKEAFIKKPRVFISKDIYKILSIGTLDTMYKAPDILLQVVKTLNDRNLKFKVELYWVGDGKHRGDVINLAKDLNITEMVHFYGTVREVEKLRSIIDASDIFVLASKTEGLPRAMIEAMARAIPCIGTNIGGIPELLPDDHLVEINEVELLVEKIITVLSNESIYEKASSENLKKSKSYRIEELNKRRFSFYNELISLTKEA